MTRDTASSPQLDRRSTGPTARRVRLLTLTLGLGLLGASVLNAIAAGREADRQRRDASLVVEASVQRAALGDYFERSRGNAKLLAESAAFDQFYLASDDRITTIRSGGPLMDDVNDALAVIEDLYPGQISEVCFIDLSGAENARVVHGVPAPLADLSTDESTNEFFHPTAHAVSDVVIQSKPYMSPDTEEFVISNSTPVTLDDGSIRSMVHFEVTLESFRKAAIAAAPTHRVFVIDAETGAVLIDTEQAVTVESVEANKTSMFVELAESGGSSGLATLDGTRFAYERVPGGDNNMNNWLVAVSSAATSEGGARWTGAQLVTLVLALVVVLLALVGIWSNERSLRLVANTDELTGAFNRRALSNRLQQMTRSSAEENGAVVLIDLDGFKQVNDSLGHQCGDELLIAVANRIRSCTRHSDVVARIGGDEFAVLIPDVGAITKAVEVVERIVAAIKMPVYFNGHEVVVGASAGIAMTPDHGTDVEALLRAADSAMYQVKASGGGWAVAVYPTADRSGSEDIPSDWG